MQHHHHEPFEVTSTQSAQMAPTMQSMLDVQSVIMPTQIKDRAKQFDGSVQFGNFPDTSGQPVETSGLFTSSYVCLRQRLDCIFRAVISMNIVLHFLGCIISDLVPLTNLAKHRDSAWISNKMVRKLNKVLCRRRLRRLGIFLPCQSLQRKPTPLSSKSTLQQLIATSCRRPTPCPTKWIFRIRVGWGCVGHSFL